MYFESGNRYLLTGVESKTYNPLHEMMLGRICELVSFRLNEYGYFKVDFDGEYHRIHTTRVKDVDATDFANEVVVTTQNTVYTFAKVFDAPTRNTPPEED